MKIRVFFNQAECPSLEFQGDRDRLELPFPGGVGLCTVKFSVPLVDIQQYWLPKTEGVCNRLSWTFEFLCGAQSGFPLCSFFNREGENRLTFGMDDLVDDTRVFAEVNQAACTYDVTIEIACCEETGPIHLLLDRRPVQWMDAVAEARDEVMPEVPGFPEDAWEPVFCTWYAVHGAVDAAWAERTAPIALGLGFHTLIVDDGWCYPEYKRVSPETLPDWYQDIGDWEVDKTKFPDMPAHVKRIQALGMKYLLWTTAMLWGTRSKRFAEHPEALTPLPLENSCRKFDARHEEAGRAIARRLGELVAENGLDGLKVDFVDVVPNDPHNPNGRASLRLVQAISGAIRQSASPNALIEFRQNYDTPQMLPYATQFRASDAPFDYILNFERCVQIRLCVGDGVPVHADPAYWAPNEVPENIARHFFAMMVGVPMLSMDLEKLPSETMTIIRHWMDFYSEHQSTLNFGHWEFGFSEGNCTWARVTGGEEHIIILADAARLAEAADVREGDLPIIVLNLSSQEIWCEDETEVFQYDGTPVEPEEADDFPIIPPGGYGRFFLDDLDDQDEDFDEKGDFDEDEPGDDESDGLRDFSNLSPFLH
ncbi:MAG: alpha-galactosidase [Victivallales bacterium]|nr:alpha-galactosidase [Victivallales bacterium]